MDHVTINHRDPPSGDSPEDNEAAPARFVLQVCLSEPPEVEEWDAIHRFADAAESFRICSECFESVQMMLGIDPISGPEPEWVRFRVWDRQECRMILWQEEGGALFADAAVFPDAARKIQPRPESGSPSTAPRIEF